MSPSLIDHESYQITAPAYPDIPETSSLVVQSILGEIDREIDDTRARLRSAIYASEGSGIRLYDNNDSHANDTNSGKRRSSDIKRSSSVWSDEEEISRLSTGSTLSEGLKRYSSLLRMARLPSLRRKERQAARQHDIETVVSRFHHDHDALFASDTASSYDGASQTSCTAEEEAQVERWLQLGAYPAPPEGDWASQRSETPSAASELGRPTLSVVPSLPTSANAYDLRASPTSPLNNGRDAYGNFLPTNTQDYLTAQPSPTSLHLRSIEEEADEPKSIAAPSLRGGGASWDTGVGQSDKPQYVKKHSFTSRASSAMRSKSSLDAHDPFTDASRNTGGCFYRGGEYPNAKGQTAITTSQEYFDEVSDVESFDTDGLCQSKVLLESFDTNSEDARTHGYTASSTAVNPTTLAFDKRQEPVVTGFPYPMRPGVSASARERLNARFASRTSPQANLFNERGATSPTSERSYEARLAQQWHQAPSTVPSMQAPPPPPQDQRLSSPTASYVKLKPHDQYAYEYGLGSASHPRPIDPNYYPPSIPPRDDDDDETSYEVMSVAPGESISVVGRPERRRVAPIRAPTVGQMTEEEYEAQQMVAQADFRGLCENVMARYNSSLLRLQNELLRGDLTEGQFVEEKRVLERNRERALKRSARRCGYVVST